MPESTHLIFKHFFFIIMAAAVCLKCFCGDATTWWRHYNNFWRTHQSTRVVSSKFCMSVYNPFLVLPSMCSLHGFPRWACSKHGFVSGPRTHSACTIWTCLNTNWTAPWLSTARCLYSLLTGIHYIYEVEETSNIRGFESFKKSKKWDTYGSGWVGWGLILKKKKKIDVSHYDLSVLSMSGMGFQK